MERKWWKEAIGYEIYPRSFKDTDGDGIGDLKGIIEKLPYLEKLGIDFIWICPFYPSPMHDNGYDVADYYGVDPCFGSMEDMEALLAAAKKCGIRVIIDMVLNHTSDQHLWFQEALKNPESKYRDFYIFRESETLPSNARSCFGGPVWERVTDNVWYYHTFDRTQPDLNWECEELRREIYKILNFWLDKGVSGFRLDAITYIKKAASLEMAEPDGEDGLCNVGRLGQNQPGIGEFLKEMRRECLETRDVLTVAEAPGVPYGQLGAFIGEDGYFSMIFDFSYADIDLMPGGNWHEQAPWTFGDLKRLIFDSQRSVQEQGWGAVYLENHDQSRSLNKYFREKAALPENPGLCFLQSTALATLLMGLRGTVFLYQGEELGMENCPFTSIEEYNDLNTIDQYHRALDAGVEHSLALKYVNDRSRDNSRTPYPWDGGENAGFTEGKPWLKINPAYENVNARRQQEDSCSVFSYYKKVISMRKNPGYRETLVYGEIQEIKEVPEEVIALRRMGADGSCVEILVNMSDEPRTVQDIPGDACIMVNNYEAGGMEKGENPGVLRPYEVYMLKYRIKQAEREGC